MARSHDGKRLNSSELSEGDKVLVTVNDRACGHIGTQSFEAVVEDTALESVKFRPTEELENQEDMDTHTWYTDIGYIHGYHTGLERYSDIGKVRKVQER